MKERKKSQVHIGTIGHTDHSKRTFKEAVNIAMNNKENDYPYKVDSLEINKGGFEMIKGIKNYVGSTVLGYRFVLDKNSSKKIKYTKGNSKIKSGTMHNKVKVLNKRNDYSK